MLSFLPSLNHTLSIYSSKHQTVQLPNTLNAYEPGRRLGDEYMYVMDRKRRKPNAGILLSKPSFLLNKHDVRETETSKQAARAGDERDMRSRNQEYGTARCAAAMPYAMSSRGLGPGGCARAYNDIDFSVDFLATPSTLLANLVADADGNLFIPASKYAATRGNS